MQWSNAPIVGFVSLLALAAWFDARQRRVPNALALVVLGAALGGVLVGAAPAARLSSALLGVLTGLALWLPFWLLRLLGAGDVKFFAAASAWVGPSLAVKAALVAALMGGLLGLIMLVQRRGWQETSALVRTTIAMPAGAIVDVSAAPSDERTLPYAIPMAIALGVTAVFPDYMRKVLF